MAESSKPLECDMLKEIIQSSMVEAYNSAGLYLTYSLVSLLNYIDKAPSGC